MPVFLSDTQANMLERAQTDLAKLLADLRDLSTDFLADADSDRDAQAMTYVENAFSLVYQTHNELRTISDFLREPEPDGPDELEDKYND